jgi:hypothetical protein
MDLNLLLLGYPAMDAEVGRKLLKTLNKRHFLPIYSTTVVGGKTLNTLGFEDCGIRSSKLTNCVILNSTITCTVLDGCILVNCDVRNCTLKNSHVNGSSVIDSEWINPLRSKCEVRPTPPFNRMPPEARAMILSEAMTWNGKVLFAALHGDPILHREALEVFRNTCAFTVRNANDLTQKIMSQPRFQCIQKFAIK